MLSPLPLIREASGLTLAIDSFDQLAYYVTAYCTEDAVYVVTCTPEGVPVHEQRLDVDSPAIRRLHPEHVQATQAGAVAA